MNNCDMIYVYIANSTVIIMDTFAEGNVRPVIDNHNDIEVTNYAIN